MPLGRLDVEIVGFTPATTILRLFVTYPALFVAFTVKLYVPGVVGVPLIFPAELRDSPDGRLPLERLHVGAGVPEAESVAL